MHPVIRLVSFVMLSLGLAFGGWSLLLLGTLVVATLLLRAGAPAWAAITPMMRRMRWLWLSLAVVYFWFTPGTPIVPSVPDAWVAWVPTHEGLALGALRITALALMVMSAALLLHFTAREQLFAALHWLAAPLAVFGVTRERVAVRVALTLAAVTEVRGEVQATTRHEGRPQRPWVRWGARAASLLDVVMTRAETSPCGEMHLPRQPAPPLRQWAWPIALAAVMMGVATLRS